MNLDLVKRFSIRLAAGEKPEGMPRAIVPVFHRWIHEDVVADIVPVDVADYSHVHQGPGVLLVGHYADFGLGDVAGTFGLRYLDKGRGPGDEPFSARVMTALDRALAAAARLESETGLRFHRTGVELEILDRLQEVDKAEVQALLDASLADPSRI